MWTLPLPVPPVCCSDVCRKQFETLQKVTREKRPWTHPGHCVREWHSHWNPHRSWTWFRGWNSTPTRAPTYKQSYTDVGHWNRQRPPLAFARRPKNAIVTGWTKDDSSGGGESARGTVTAGPQDQRARREFTLKGFDS